jgi:hypothetical protein
VSQSRAPSVDKGQSGSQTGSHFLRDKNNREEETEERYLRRAEEEEEDEGMEGLKRFCLWQAEYPLAVSSVRASRKAVMITRSSSGGGGGAHLPPAHHLFSNWQSRNVQGLVTTRRGRRWRAKKKEEKDSSTAAGVVREEEDMGASPMQLMLLPDFDSTMVCNLSFFLLPPTQINTYCLQSILDITKS